jgi:hypothetical protein
MYNEKIKNQFIEEKKRVAVISNNLTDIFNLAQAREERLGRDLCEWTSEEIIDFYKYMGSKSVQTLIVTNNLLTMYCNWCLQNGLVRDNQNHYLEINSVSLTKCVNTGELNDAIITREFLLNKIQLLGNYCDQFLLLALFEGINLKNDRIMKVKTSDLDGNILHLVDGIDVEISDDLQRLMTLANSENVYKGIGNSDKKNEYEYVPNDTVLRPYIYRGNVYDDAFHIVGQRFRKSIKYINMNTTIKMLSESGRIDFIKRFAARKGIDPFDVIKIKEYREENEELYGMIQNKKIYLEVYGDYLKLDTK